MSHRNSLGRVVQIRVRPQDCLACLDVLRSVNVNADPMSFANVVSVALSVVLEGLRSSKIIPDRQGFEYADMMAGFKQDVKADRKRKIDITKAYTLAPPPPLKNIGLDRKRIRFNELAARWNADPINVDEAEQAEMNALALELNPE